MKILDFLRKPFRYTFSNATLYLILINTVIYFSQRYFSLRGLSLTSIFALNPFLFVKKCMFWQAFTYMFLHGDFWHVFLNMLMFYWFGVAVERKMGSKEFLLFYLLCGSLAGIAMAWIYYFFGLRTYILGASAALYAVMLAFATLYPDSNIYLYFVLPVPSAILIIAYFVIEIVQAFANDGVAHLGHLFGLIFAWIYIRVRYRISVLKAFGFK